MMPNLGQGGCQAIEDAYVLAGELRALDTRKKVPSALSRYRDRRLVRSAAVQGLSRFASDIIIRGFDTPAKFVEGRLENANYAGIMTRLLQPVLPVFFSLQFNFLYSGWRSTMGAVETLNGLALAFVGGVLLLAFAAIAADAGLLVAFGVETASGLIESLSGTGFVEAIQDVTSSIGGFLF
jgi:zeaxanthin epoxidase